MIDSTLLFAGGPPLLITPPAQTVALSSSFGYDLNPNFGAGQQARKSPYPGLGEEIVLVLEVIQEFTIGAGTPLAQFHAAISDVGGAGFIAVGTNNFFPIGSNVGPVATLAGVSYNGFVAASLTLNTKLFVRLNPYSSIMGRSILGATIKAQDMRYLGFYMSVPNHAAAGNPFFSAGAVRGHFAKMGENMSLPADTIYPAGQVMVG